MKTIELDEHTSITDIESLQPGDTLIISSTGSRRQVRAIPRGINLVLYNTPRELVAVIPRYVKNITLVSDLPDKGAEFIHKETTVTIDRDAEAGMVSILRSRNVVFAIANHSAFYALVENQKIQNIRFLSSTSLSSALHLSSRYDLKTRTKKIFSFILHFMGDELEQTSGYYDTESSFMRLDLEKQKQLLANEKCHTAELETTLTSTANIMRALEAQLATTNEKNAVLAKENADLLSWKLSNLSKCKALETELTSATERTAILTKENTELTRLKSASEIKCIAQANELVELTKVYRELQTTYESTIANTQLFADLPDIMQADTQTKHPIMLLEEDTFRLDDAEVTKLKSDKRQLEQKVVQLETTATGLRDEINKLKQEQLRLETLAIQSQTEAALARAELKELRSKKAKGSSTIGCPAAFHQSVVPKDPFKKTVVQQLENDDVKFTRHVNIMD